MSAAAPAASESGRVLIVAPMGRDAAIASSILAEARLPLLVCADIACLLAEIEEVGVVLVAEEALQSADYPDLVRSIEQQPPWSDLPIVLIAHRGGGMERNPAARRMASALGNVTFLERPFHPTTLVSVIQTALRGRRRQYEARARIATIRAAEALLERRVEERTAELASANRQLASQIAERERVEGVLRQSQRLEAVGQLTSGVAHDFNNLLMVVLGNIRQMQKALGNDPVIQRRLNMMAQAAERGAQLTAQMLAFSRRQRLEPCAVDLNETVGGMRDLLQATMGGSVKIETVLEADLWPAMIDPTQIELVILNLAINARDAMEVGGTLTVETGNVTLDAPARPEEPAAGDYVMVSVADTGSGMTPEVLDKVFEPFFTTKAVGKGSGLGLSQVFGLAKQSGGGVRIVSSPGAGASVCVFLPRAAGVPEAPAADAPPVAEVEPGRHKVLLVDDDSAVREVTAGILQDLGYRVVEAGSGGAALDVLDRQSEIDLLLIDFAMPGMNGAEVAREVHARRPELPILFLTGYADTEALAAAGDDGILRKPFVERDLAAKLRQVLRVA